jgi:hypothetical protein
MAGSLTGSGHVHASILGSSTAALGEAPGLRLNAERA